MTEFERKLTLAVAALDEGEVVSFGDVAKAAGRPNAPRAAGSFLAKNMVELPWWRVVYANGRLPLCDVPTQIMRLEAEGVEVLRNRVQKSPRGRFRPGRH